MRTTRNLAWAAAVLCASSATAAGLPNDSVLSAHIKEADGTSGQNSNSGSGVKTPHIQDGAVINSKIAAGAVTDAKITGPISAAKISPVGLDADTVDGRHASAFALAVHGHDGSYVRRSAQELIVAADGSGDFTDPVAAVAALNGLGVIRIRPGIYTLTAPLHIKPNTRVVGSGMWNTILYVDGGGNPASAVVTIDPEAGLEDIQLWGFRTGAVLRGNSSGNGDRTLVSNVYVQADGRDAGMTTYGLDDRAGAGLRFENMVLNVSGPAAVGIAVGASGSVERCRIAVRAGQGAGIESTGSYALRIVDTVVDTWSDTGGVVDALRAPSCSGCTVAGSAFQASGFGSGSAIAGTLVQVHSSRIGSSVGYAASGSVFLANTQVSGSIGPFAPGTSARCVGAYDAAFAPLTCP